MLVRDAHDAFRRGKLWALHRSSSLRGLLFLPVPEEPATHAHPRSAPCAIRRLDRVSLAAGQIPTPASGFPIDDLPWGDLANAPIQGGDEVLALVRLDGGRSQGGAEAANRLLQSWVAAHPLADQPSWRPDRVGRRLACWSQALIEAGDRLGAAHRAAWCRSLFLQARYLFANLPDRASSDWLGCLRGLLGAGALLAGSEPRRWYQLASRQIGGGLNQFDADGGHRSRSLSTQLICLAAIIDAAALLQPETDSARTIRKRLPQLAEFTRALAHPDGTMAFAGSDAAAAPDLTEVLAAVGPTISERPSWSFPRAGFSGHHRPEWGDALMVDWVGPASATRPGAAGSIEASFGGRRLLVSAASSEDPSGAHNSVRADGRSWRAAARRLEARWGDGPGLGYSSLAWEQAGIVHHRRLLALDSRAFAVIDRVSGATTSAEARLHLAAGIRMVDGGNRRLFLEDGRSTVTLAWMPGAEIAAERAQVAHGAGGASASNVLRLWVPGGGARVIGFLLCEGRRSDAELELLEQGEERLALRFDPRRYLLRWPVDSGPRVLLAD